MDLPDSTGKTPLHVAAGTGYEWGVKVLLDANADPSIKDNKDRSVVEYAEQQGKLSRCCVQDIRDSVEKYMSGLPKHGWSGLSSSGDSDSQVSSHSL